MTAPTRRSTPAISRSASTDRFPAQHLARRTKLPVMGRVDVAFEEADLRAVFTTGRRTKKLPLSRPPKRATSSSGGSSQDHIRLVTQPHWHSRLAASPALFNSGDARFDHRYVHGLFDLLAEADLRRAAENEASALSSSTALRPAACRRRSVSAWSVQKSFTPSSA